MYFTVFIQNSIIIVFVIKIDVAVLLNQKVLNFTTPDHSAYYLVFNAELAITKSKSNTPVCLIHLEFCNSRTDHDRRLDSSTALAQTTETTTKVLFCRYLLHSAIHCGS